MNNNTNRIVSFRDANVTPALRHYLENANIHTMNELSSYSYDEVCNIPGIGVTTRDKLKVKLNQWGLDFSHTIIDEEGKTIILDADQSNNFDRLNRLMEDQNNYRKSMAELQKAIDNNAEEQKEIILKIKKNTHIKENNK